MSSEGGDIALGYYIEQGVYLAFGAFVTFANLLQYHRSLHSRTFGQLQKLFHRLLPVFGLVVIAQAVDPYGWYDINTRLIISLLRWFGGSCSMVLVPYFAFLGFDTSRESLVPRPQDMPQRRIVRGLLITCATLFIVITFVVAILRSIYPDEYVIDEVRYATVATNICISWSILMYYMFKVHAKIKAGMWSTQQHGLPPNAEYAVARVQRMMHLLYAGTVAAAILFILYVRLAIRTVDNPEHFPEPEHKKPSYQFTPSSMSLLAQAVISFIATLVSWIPPPSKERSRGSGSRGRIHVTISPGVSTTDLTATGSPRRQQHRSPSQQQHSPRHTHTSSMDVFSFNTTAAAATTTTT